MKYPHQIAYNNLVLYMRDNPGRSGKAAMHTLNMTVDQLYPLLREAQAAGHIRKEGATSNAKFYAVECK